jgi:predicted nucleic acid-binding protein
MKSVERGNSMIIIDASVYFPLILKGGDRLVTALRKHEFTILDLTIYEACNAAWKSHVIYQILDHDAATQVCIVAKELAERLHIFSFHTLNFESAMKIAIENKIAVYDSAYIFLATYTKSPIATEDRDILRVAPKYGIEVLRYNEMSEILFS